MSAPNHTLEEFNAASELRLLNDEDVVELLGFSATCFTDKESRDAAFHTCGTWIFFAATDVAARAVIKITSRAMPLTRFYNRT